MRSGCGREEGHVCFAKSLPLLYRPSASRVSNARNERSRPPDPSARPTGRYDNWRCGGEPRARCARRRATRARSSSSRPDSLFPHDCTFIITRKNWTLQRHTCSSRHMLARRRAPLTNGRIHRIQFNAHHRLSDTRVPAFIVIVVFSY